MLSFDPDLLLVQAPALWSIRVGPLTLFIIHRALQVREAEGKGEMVFIQKSFLQFC